jgi:bifunctional N-acetylglucosamine-1-phosphate-uridyltransferase/glucosamine-1-phosphate-acetyltransferase GlmU-like protein
VIGLITVNQLIKNLAQIKNMYNKRSKEDLLKAGVTAALGAGIITSFAVSQGQDPLIALGITVFAAVAAVICDRLGLI